MPENSKLTLTSLRSGFSMQASGGSGTMRTTSSVTALVGYTLATEAGKDGVPYTKILLTAQNPAVDPPVLELAANYEQLIAYPEVDLDLRYTDIPADTEVEVEATNPVFSIPRQPIQGSSLIGVIGEDQEEFSTALVLRLWIKNPETLKATAALSLSFSHIEKSPGSADKKLLLQKIALNLSN